MVSLQRRPYSLAAAQCTARMGAATYGCRRGADAARIAGLPLPRFRTTRNRPATHDCSRSFQGEVGTLAELKEVVATYALTVAEKLRGFNQKAGVVSVFLLENRFKHPAERDYYQSASLELPVASSEGGTLRLLAVWRRGCSRRARRTKKRASWSPNFPRPGHYRRSHGFPSKFKVAIFTVFLNRKKILITQPRFCQFLSLADPFLPTPQ